MKCFDYEINDLEDELRIFKNELSNYDDCCDDDDCYSECCGDE